jgi:PAS domain S-box-containing protein
VVLRAIYDEHSKLIGFAKVTQDVTEQKQADDALKESEARYRSLFDTVYDGIWEWDMKTDEVFWNDRLYEMHGLDKTTFTPNIEAFMDLVHPDDRITVQNALNQHLEDGVPYLIEIRQRHSSGHYRTFFARGAALRDTSGIPYRVVGATLDITERKDAEAALKESESRFRLFADQSPVLIAMSDKDTDLIYFNKTWLDFTGRTLEEEVAFGWVNGIHPDDREQVVNTYLAAYREEIGFEVEYRLKRYDGEYRWMYSKIAPRFTPTSEFSGYIGSIVDIHDRKQAEDSLREASLRYEALLSNIPDQVWMKDQNLVYIADNETHARDFGTTREAIIGKTDHDLLPLDLAKQCIASDQVVLATGQPYVSEESLNHPDGTSSWYHVYKNPLKDTQGNVAGIVGIAHNITYRKLADMAIRESEERFRTMADAAAILVWTSDADGAGDYFNKTWLEFTGRTLEEELGYGWTQGIHADDKERCIATCAEAKRNRSNLKMEFRLRRADGQYRWVLDTATPRFTPEGELVGYIGSMVDITEMKQAQEELAEYARRLEHSNKELEQFATVASHDLQEPLRKVMLFSQFIQQASDCHLTVEAQDYLARMQNAVERMQALITDLLDLSRVNRKGQAFRKIDLNRVARDSLSDLHYMLKDTQGKVNVGELPEIEADDKQIGQLFLNLIGNALKFHRQGVPPVVIVSAQIVEKQFCRILVQDNGIGFEEKYLSRIFGIFERLHGRGEYPGSGIGLAICDKIVQRHGGNITASSTPGEGSTFIITLPLKQAECS